MTTGSLPSRLFLAAALWWLSALAALAETLPREALAPLIVPPMELGERLNDEGVWQLLNSGGAEAGYVFETEPMAPLPGFSGAPMNMLVVLDLNGNFLDVQLISHNEPIFVSGLGEAPFHKFFEQYRGHSIADSLVVGTPYGSGSDGSALVYLDGVTKATASVRIAHESLLAAALKVAREKMKGVATGPPAYPDPDYAEDLTWDDLVAQGIAVRKRVTNAEVDAAFAGTLWEDDDPEAQDYPEETYLDLWVVDLGPPSVARAVLSPDGYAELRDFMAISTTDEPVLVVETARHGLVPEDFVRNTAPDLLSAEQGGFPVAFRDADIYVEMNAGMPEEIRDGTALILRTDRRLGFDPTAEWTLHVKSLREHGFFQPEIGSATFDVALSAPERFFARPEVVEPAPPWLGTLQERRVDLAILSVFLVGLVALLGVRLDGLAAHRHVTPIRLGILAFVIGFVGWWGQGRDAARGAAHGTGRGQLRLPALRSVLARHLGRDDPRVRPLGAGAVLRVAVPVRRDAGIRASSGPRAAPAPDRAERDVGRAAQMAEIRGADRSCRHPPHPAGPARQGHRGRAVQDRRDDLLRPRMVLRRLCSGAAGPVDGAVQGVLPLSLPAGGGDGHRRAAARARLDRAAGGMRLAVPAVPGEVQLRRDREERGGELQRVLPVPRLRDDPRAGDGLRAEDHRREEARA